MQKGSHKEYTKYTWREEKIAKEKKCEIKECEWVAKKFMKCGIQECKSTNCFRKCEIKDCELKTE